MKLTTNDIILWVFMFICGCACALYTNTTRNDNTPIEFLNEKQIEPPKVEFEHPASTNSTLGKCTFL